MNTRTIPYWPLGAAGLLILIFAVILLFGCKTPMTPQQQAAAQTASNLAHIAVEAAATYYGGAAGAELASAGLDAGAAVLQGYVGTNVPPQILATSPGIKGIGSLLVQQIVPNHVVSQADVNKLQAAAQIAATLRPAIVAPTNSP